MQHIELHLQRRRRLEPGVSLYSRKVLIEQSPEDLLPSWLRFVRGVVDSEDVPLAISREKAQDRALVRKIRDVVTRKLLRHWDGMLRRQPTEYRAFFHEFGVFLKEGACQDYENMEQIAKLLEAAPRAREVLAHLRAAAALVEVPQQTPEVDL